MKSSPLYNGQNVVFTGNAYNNPYGLIQKIGGKPSNKKLNKRTNKRLYKKHSQTRKTHKKSKYCILCHLFGK